MGISTHILDTALGQPAAGVPVSLARQADSGWTQRNTAKTDADGRVRELLPATEPLEGGVYRARFDTAAYYQARGLDGLYPYVDIVFRVDEGQLHYHVPLLLTANGYTTYRGS